MSKPVQKIERIRRYGESFKRNLVFQYTSGKHTVRELCKLYGVSDHSIYTWIRKYSHFEQGGIIVIEHAESSSEKFKNMEAQIKALEQSLGQKQMLLEYYKKLVELAEAHYEIDIKKNFGTKSSDGSNNTPKR